MDPKKTPKLSVNYKCQEQSVDQNNCNTISRNGVFVQLEGTHTSATSTDQLDLDEEHACTSKQLPSQKSHASESGPKIALEVQEHNRDYSYKLSEAPHIKVEKINKPVEEMIQEMNDNIQTIMDMFGHKSMKNGSEDEDLNSAQLRQVTFQESSRTKTTAIESPNRSQFNKFLEAKKHRITGLDSTELERISPSQPSTETDQRHVDYHSSDRNNVDSNQKLLMIQSSRAVNFSGKERSSNSEKINEIREEKRSDILDIRGAKLFSIKPDEVIIPICDGIGGGNVSLAPCENVFHTLHIEAASSPTSSVMYRPPICTRLWSVITDFITAICLCLQVNRDCIFCLGFFVAFVVSASFLTAFFYRTLSVDPQALQQIQQRQQSQDILRNDNIEVGSQGRGYR